MALQNSKQSTKPYKSHLGIIGVHTHQFPTNCIQSCCSIHMLCLRNVIFIVITMDALIHIHNDQYGNDAEWCEYRSGTWFHYWHIGQVLISFWIKRNQNFYQCW